MTFKIVEIDKMENRRVVFFVPSFMGYEKSIDEALKQNFSDVKLFDQRSVQTGFGKALSKKFPRLLRKRNVGYYKSKVDSISFIPTDVVVIQGDMIEHETVQYMRKLWPEVKIRLYMWDNLQNLKGVEKKISWFDSVSSFDPGDVETNDLIKFRPLFFSQDYANYAASNARANEVKYDASFIGTIHSDRNRVVFDIFQSLDHDATIFDYRYLQTRWIYFVYKMLKRDFKGSKFSDFKYQTLSAEAIADVVDQSNVVIDINHPKQRGLTIRTFELLAMNKKMITTNAEVKRYDFYNPANIHVIQRDKDIVVPKLFLQSEYVKIDEKIVNKYSITSWLFDILEIKNEI